MLYIAAALIVGIVGFILGAIEGRTAVDQAKQIAASDDVKLKAALDAAVEKLHDFAANGESEAALSYAHIIATIKGAL